MPIMPSPSYHKYDVTNYMEIENKYGSMEDFESLTEWQTPEMSTSSSTWS
jgi:glycosidase